MTDGNGWNTDWNDDWAETTAAAPDRDPVDVPFHQPPPERRGGGRSGGGGMGSGLIGAVIGALVVAVLGLGGYVLLTRDDGSAPAAVDQRRAPSAPEDPAVSDGGSALGALPGADSSADPSAGTDAGTGNAPDSGTYSGVLSQRGTRRSDQDFSVSMTFSSQGSTVDYPSLGCSGTLSPSGDSAGARVYSETITSGRCDQSGTWYVTRGADGDSLSVEYRAVRSDYVVVGQLTR